MPEAGACHALDSEDDLAVEQPQYDSCADEVNQILFQSIQDPDPDPNLGPLPAPSAGLSREEFPRLIQQEPGKPPRTSEIFRSVVASGPDTTAPVMVAEPDPPSEPAPLFAAPPEFEPEPAPDRGPALPDLVVLGQDQGRPVTTPEQAPEEEEEGAHGEPRVPWSQILLLSYSSAITLALIVMLWTGQWARNAAQNGGTADQPIVESSSRAAEPVPTPPAPPIPPENRAALGTTIQLGDLEVTPLAVIAAPLELVRSIEPDDRRQEKECLVLQLRLTNISEDHMFSPLDKPLVREHGTRPHDPYIATSEKSSIPLFPLAVDSEWSIVGQEFATLEPGDSEETFVAAAPGSARHLTAEMTWRVRLRTGVYRTDLLAVPFTPNEVRHKSAVGRDGEE